MESCICHHCKETETCFNARLKRYEYNGVKSLSGLELRVLDYLLVNRGIVVTHNQIMDAIWGDDPISTSALRTVVWRISKKIPGLIKSKRGYGYFVKKELPESFFTAKEA